MIVGSLVLRGTAVTDVTVKPGDKSGVGSAGIAVSLTADGSLVGCSVSIAVGTGPGSSVPHPERSPTPTMKAKKMLNRKTIINILIILPLRERSYALPKMVRQASDSPADNKRDGVVNKPDEYSPTAWYKQWLDQALHSRLHEQLAPLSFLYT